MKDTVSNSVSFKDIGAVRKKQESEKKTPRNNTTWHQTGAM